MSYFLNAIQEIRDHVETKMPEFYDLGGTVRDEISRLFSDENKYGLFVIGWFSLFIYISLWPTNFLVHIFLALFPYDIDEMLGFSGNYFMVIFVAYCDNYLTLHFSADREISVLANLFYEIQISIINRSVWKRFTSEETGYSKGRTIVLVSVGILCIEAGDLKLVHSQIFTPFSFLLLIGLIIFHIGCHIDLMDGEKRKRLSENYYLRKITLTKEKLEESARETNAGASDVLKEAKVVVEKKPVLKVGANLYSRELKDISSFAWRAGSRVESLSLAKMGESTIGIKSISDMYCNQALMGFYVLEYANTARILIKAVLVCIIAFIFAPIISQSCTFLSINVTNEFLTGEIVTAAHEIFPGSLSIFLEFSANWYRVLVVVSALVMKFSFSMIPQSRDLVAADVKNFEDGEKKTQEIHDAHSVLGALLLIAGLLHFPSLESKISFLLNSFRDFYASFSCELMSTTLMPVFGIALAVLIGLYFLIVGLCRFGADVTKYTKSASRYQYETLGDSNGFLAEFAIYFHHARLLLALPLLVYSWPYLKEYTLIRSNVSVDGKILFWLCVFVSTLFLDSLIDLCVLMSQARMYYLGKGVLYYADESRVLGNLSQLCVVYLALPSTPVCLVFVALLRMFCPVAISSERHQQSLSLLLSIAAFSLAVWNVALTNYYLTPTAIDSWLVRVLFVPMAYVLRESVFLSLAGKYYCLDFLVLLLVDFLSLHYSNNACVLLFLAVLSVGTSIRGRQDFSTTRDV